MGVNFKDFFEKKVVSFSDLKNKVVVFDGHNMLYQFLTTIRGPDGAVFTNKEGVVTSHMIGLFSRVTKLLLENIKLVFVFDGVPPDIKKKEIERRINAKKDAQFAFEKAEKDEDIEGMKKFAGRTAKLTKDMVEQAKELLNYFGVPWIQAPSEGEAQAAHVVNSGKGWAVASQDFDSLLYGTPFVIQNLSISGKRKLPRKFAYVNVEPELIDLNFNLNRLGLTLKQLRIVAILVGTDYNPKGVSGIGPKKALALVKKFGNADDIFKEVGLEESVWKPVLNTFESMPVTDDFVLKWSSVDKIKVRDFLVNKLDFSEERVDNSLSKFKNLNQKSLGAFL
jgi:flap endonuclease-1